MSRKLPSIKSYISFLTFTTLLIIITLPFTAFSHDTNSSRIINEIKSFIRQTKDVYIEFEQIHYEGQFAKKENGILIINKPHRFRCNYLPPFPLLIVGNKSYISIYDYEMKNLTRISSQENPFGFLLVEEGDFEKELEIISAKEHNSVYYLIAKHKKTEKINKIAFDKKTKELKYLKIIEGLSSTEIHFNNLRKIKNAKNELFVLKEPRNFGAPPRFDVKDLEKRVEFSN